MGKTTAVEAAPAKARPAPVRRSCGCARSAGECSCHAERPDPGAVLRTLDVGRVGAGTAPRIFGQLEVSTPGDPAEVEADRVADEVLHMPEPAVSAPDRPPPALRDRVPRQADGAHRPEAEDGAHGPEAEDGAHRAEDVERRLDRAQGRGTPLAPSVRGFFEPRLGQDLGGVRVHTDPAAGRLAQDLGAVAFARGPDVFFAPGRYAPESAGGQRLLAHELAHTLQPADGAGSVLRRVRRQAAPTVQPAPPTGPSGAQVVGGTAVHALGLVGTDEGVHLRSQPTDATTLEASTILTLLPLNTLLFVNRELPGGWYHVALDDGRMGYVAKANITTDLPDPGSKLHRIQPGESALKIVKQYYKADAISWGQDERFYVNVLVFVNAERGRKGIWVPTLPPAIQAMGLQPSWDMAQTVAGRQIWIPSLEFALTLKSRVSSGSISREIVRSVTDFFEAVADFVIGGVAFIGGLIVGALECVWDTLTGIVDLVKMIAEVIKSIITGEFISDIRKIGEMLSQLDAHELLYALAEWLDERWNNPSLAKRWYWRGWMIGYVIVEVLLAIFSDGLIVAVKWLAKTSKIAKLLERFPAFLKLVERARTLTGTKIEEVKAALRASKVIKGLAEAREWVVRILKIPVQLAERLTAPAIEQLKRLPTWMLDRFADLSHATMKFLLGCDSPCKVNAEFIKHWMAEVGTESAKKARKLKTSDDVVGALPAALKKQKIAKYLDDHPALMAAIKEAELTDDDFAKMVHFLSPSDLESPQAAYRTFTRYLSHVVPAKAGKDVKKLNAVAEAMVLADPRQASALKGPMFELWARMHLPEFSSKTFERMTFERSKKLLLRKTKRTADNFVAETGELWEIKHTFDKVPLDQVEDYLMISRVHPDTVKSVNYLFADKAMAETNRHLKPLGVVVWYVEGGVRKAL